MADELQVLLVRICELIELPARSPERAGSKVGVATAAPATGPPPPYGRPRKPVRWPEGWPCRSPHVMWGPPGMSATPRSGPPAQHPPRPTGGGSVADGDGQKDSLAAAGVAPPEDDAQEGGTEAAGVAPPEDEGGAADDDTQEGGMEAAGVAPPEDEGGAADDDAQEGGMEAAGAVLRSWTYGSPRRQSNLEVERLRFGVTSNTEVLGRSVNWMITWIVPNLNRFLPPRTFPTTRGVRFFNRMELLAIPQVPL